MQATREAREERTVTFVSCGLGAVGYTDIRHFDQGTASRGYALERTGSCRMGEGQEVS